MQVLLNHIHRVKQQPHHIRRQVVLVVATGVAVLIALIWLIGSLAMGSFAIGDSNFAENTGAEVAPENTDSIDSSQVAGAAAAVPSDNSAARIQVIDSATTTKTQPEQTVIPF